MDEHERAPAYLLSLQDELDAMGRFPPLLVPAGILSLLAAALFASGVVGFVATGDVAALPWTLFGGIVAFPAVILTRNTLDWFRRRRTLRRGIALIDARRLKRARAMGRDQLAEESS